MAPARGQKTRRGIEGEDPAAAGIERFVSLILFFTDWVAQIDTLAANLRAWPGANAAHAVHGRGGGAGGESTARDLVI